MHVMQQKYEKELMTLSADNAAMHQEQSAWQSTHKKYLMTLKTIHLMDKKPKSMLKYLKNMLG